MDYPYLNAAEHTHMKHSNIWMNGTLGLIQQHRYGFAVWSYGCQDLKTNCLSLWYSDKNFVQRLFSSQQFRQTTQWHNSSGMSSLVCLKSLTQKVSSLDISVAAFQLHRFSKRAIFLSITIQATTGKVLSIEYILHR